MSEIGRISIERFQKECERTGALNSQTPSELSPAHCSDAGRDFEAWWARNCYTIRDMIAGEVQGSSGRLRRACLKVWSASREQSNNQAHRSAPEVGVERNKTEGKSNEQ